MPAAIHTDVFVTIDKQTGEVAITASSNRLKFLQFAEEDEQCRRILLATMPEGRTSKLMEEKMGWSKHVVLRIRAARPK